MNPCDRKHLSYQVLPALRVIFCVWPLSLIFRELANVGMAQMLCTKTFTLQCPVTNEMVQVRAVLVSVWSFEKVWFRSMLFSFSDIYVSYNCNVADSVWFGGVGRLFCCVSSSSGVLFYQRFCNKLKHFDKSVEGGLQLTYLAANIPHLLWVIVGGVCPEAARVDPAQLPCVVLHKICPWRKVWGDYVQCISTA